MMSVTYDECHKYALIAECRYAECRYIECRNTEFNGDNIKLHGRKLFGENFKIFKCLQTFSGYTTESLPNWKVQYHGPPCTNLFRTAAFDIANMI